MDTAAAPELGMEQFTEEVRMGVGARPPAFAQEKEEMASGLASRSSRLHRDESWV